LGAIQSNIHKLISHSINIQAEILAKQTQFQEPDEVRLARRLQEAEGVQNLLLAIIRRAAQDWVLYRDSTRRDQKICADEAYVWLFVEDENHPYYELRKKSGRSLTSFLNICEVLDLAPDRVRQHIRRLTKEKIKSLGRRPSTGSGKVNYEEHVIEVNFTADYDALILSMLPSYPE